LDKVSSRCSRDIASVSTHNQRTTHVATKYPLAFGGLPLPLSHQGKTRDSYDLIDSSKLLPVTDNRLSTHNIVHESLIPLKGQVLTALSIFWMTRVLVDVPNHLVAYGRRIYDVIPKITYPKDLHLQAVVIRRYRVEPIEFVLRGYNAGSFEKGTRTGWPDDGGVDPYGYNFRRDLPLMTRFDPPLSTPTNKSEKDEPRNAEEIAKQYGVSLAAARTNFSLVRRYANARGIEIVDTKEEMAGNVLVDEAFTPDSSRYTELSEIKEGVEPKWLDKQIARDEAERIWGKGKKVPLTFSPKIVTQLTDTYLALFHRLTGETLQEFQQHTMA